MYALKQQLTTLIKQSHLKAALRKQVDVKFNFKVITTHALTSTISYVTCFKIYNGLLTEITANHPIVIVGSCFDELLTSISLVQ